MDGWTDERTQLGHVMRYVDCISDGLNTADVGKSSTDLLVIQEYGLFG